MLRFPRIFYLFHFAYTICIYPPFDSHKEVIEVIMEDMITKRNQLRAQQLIQALKQRNMDASYAATRKEALEQALAWIPQGSRIGWGG